MITKPIFNSDTPSASHQYNSSQCNPISPNPAPPSPPHPLTILSGTIDRFFRDASKKRITMRNKF